MIAATALPALPATPATGIGVVTGTLTVAVSSHLAESDTLLATASSIAADTPGLGLRIVDIDDDPEAAVRLGIVAAPAVVVDAGGRRKVLSGRPSASKLRRALLVEATHDGRRCRPRSLRAERAGRHAL